VNINRSFQLVGVLEAADTQGIPGFDPRKTWYHNPNKQPSPVRNSISKRGKSASLMHGCLGIRIVEQLFSWQSE